MYKFMKTALASAAFALISAQATFSEEAAKPANPKSAEDMVQSCGKAIEDVEKALGNKDLPRVKYHISLAKVHQDFMNKIRTRGANKILGRRCMKETAEGQLWLKKLENMKHEESHSHKEEMKEPEKAAKAH